MLTLLYIIDIYYIILLYIILLYIILLYIILLYIILLYIVLLYTNWKETYKDEILYDIKHLPIGLPSLSLEPWKSNRGPHYSQQEAAQEVEAGEYCWRSYIALSASRYIATRNTCV